MKPKRQPERIITIRKRQRKKLSKINVFFCLRQLSQLERRRLRTIKFFLLNYLKVLLVMCVCWCWYGSVEWGCCLLESFFFVYHFTINLYWHQCLQKRCCFLLLLSSSSLSLRLNFHSFVIILFKLKSCCFQQFFFNFPWPFLWNWVCVKRTSKRMSFEMQFCSVQSVCQAVFIHGKREALVLVFVWLFVAVFF